MINLIIDRLGVSIKPYASGLLQLLPSVWERAEGQSLLRIQASYVVPLKESVDISMSLSAQCISALLRVTVEGTAAAE